VLVPASWPSSAAIEQSSATPSRPSIRAAIGLVWL
jgi:hypothetical protein